MSAQVFDLADKACHAAAAKLMADVVGRLVRSEPGDILILEADRKPCLVRRDSFPRTAELRGLQELVADVTAAPILAGTLSVVCVVHGRCALLSMPVGEPPRADAGATIHSINMHPRFRGTGRST